MEFTKNMFYLMNSVPDKMSRFLVGITDRELGHLGLKAYHTIVMATIGFEPGTTQKRIIESTPFNKARVSTIVSELIDMGYVVNGSVGKASSLVLTPEGERIFGICRHLFISYHRELFSAISPDELEMLFSIYSKLNSKLDGMLKRDTADR